MMTANEIREWFTVHKANYMIEAPKGSDEQLQALRTDPEIVKVANLCAKSVQIGWAAAGVIPTALDVVVFALQVGFVLGQQAAEGRQLERMTQL